MKKAGGLWIKLNANSAGRGMPDRVLVTWNGRVVWIELKTTRGVLSSAQKNAHAELRGVHQTVLVVRSSKEIVDTLN